MLYVSELPGLEKSKDSAITSRHSITISKTSNEVTDVAASRKSSPSTSSNVFPVALDDGVSRHRRTDDSTWSILDSRRHVLAGTRDVESPSDAAPAPKTSDSPSMKVKRPSLAN